MISYLLPIGLVFYNFIILPFILFRIEKFKKHERKSKKEDNFVKLNTFYIIMNSIFIPFVMLSMTHYQMVDIIEEADAPFYPKIGDLPDFYNYTLPSNITEVHPELSMVQPKSTITEDLDDMMTDNKGGSNVVNTEAYVKVIRDYAQITFSTSGFLLIYII
jgi:hypothetical protein